MSPDERRETTTGNRGTTASDHDAQIRGFLAGDLESIRLFAGWARSVAGHQAWGFQDSEDVVQATLLALVKNLRQGRFVRGNLRAYVRRIAKNMCIDNYDRLRRQGGEELDELQHSPASMNPGEALERKLLLDRILEQLEERCRRLIRLAYVEGFTRSEIGEQLGISEEAARVRLFRCIQSARALFETGMSGERPGRS